MKYFRNLGKSWHALIIILCVKLSKFRNLFANLSYFFFILSIFLSVLIFISIYYLLKISLSFSPSVCLSFSYSLSSFISKSSDSLSFPSFSIYFFLFVLFLTFSHIVSSTFNLSQCLSFLFINSLPPLLSLFLYLFVFMMNDDILCMIFRWRFRLWHHITTYSYRVFYKGVFPWRFCWSITNIILLQSLL